MRCIQARRVPARCAEETLRRRGVSLSVPVRKRPLGLVLIVAYKAIWGLLEIATGVFVSWVPALLRRELAEDPQDQLTNWLLAHAPLEPAQVRAAVVAFVALGALKVAIAVGVWYGSWRVRDAA